MTNRQTFGQSGLKALTLIVLFLAVYCLVRALISLFVPSSDWQDVKITPPASADTLSSGAASFTLDFDPFYRDAPIDNAPPDDGSIDAPETSLDLTLKGIISGDNGRVTLQMADGQERSFGLDEEIINGVTLSAIHDNYIVLSQGGRKEKLTFEKDEKIGLSSKVQPRSRPSSSLPSRRARQSSFNQSALLEMVNVRRINEKGRIKGYEIKSIRPELDLRQMGLQDGDILVELGNTDLTRGQANWLDAMQKMARTGGGSAQIIRNGRAMTVRIKMP